MPDKREVGSLARLTLDTLSGHIHSLYRTTELKQVEEVSQGVEALLATWLQPELRRALAQLVWRRLARDWDQGAGARARVREAVVGLVGEHTTVLDFTQCRLLGDNSKAAGERSIMRRVYARLGSSCPRLHTLGLGQSFFFQRGLISDLNTVLAQLPGLTTLKLHYVGVDGMLDNIAQLCPRLRELSLNGSTKMGDATAEEVSLCKHLSRLDIQGTSITARGCLTLIESCPRLVWIEHCPFNCDSGFQIFRTRKEMLEMIRAGYNNADEEDAHGLQRHVSGDREPYRIKNFWLLNPRSEELQVAPLFPGLETLRLDFVFQDLGQLLTVTSLSNLTHLTSLELNFYDGNRNQLLADILSACGSRLTTLVYSVCAPYRAVVDCHNIISAHCPLLVSLTVAGDYGSNGAGDAEADAVLRARGPDWQPHPLLEQLSLGGYCTDQRLAWLLGGCPRLRSLHLDGNLEHLTPAAFTSITAENSLEQLESVWWNTSTLLTMDTVRLLLASCPRLARLGRLVHLAGADRRSFLQLEEEARASNWDLDLVWVTPTSP